MKPHHIVSVVLMGWFLMTPPFVGPGGRGMLLGDVSPGVSDLDLEAPLNEWRKVRSFDSSDACEDELKGLKRNDKPGVPSLADNYQCVYEGDPRLRG